MSFFAIFGAKIKYFRTLKNMTQLQLAERAAISEDYLSQIERGKASGLTIATALKIAEALEVNFEALVKKD